MISQIEMQAMAAQISQGKSLERIAKALGRIADVLERRETVDPDE
jgi:hypothetical protein